MAGVLAVSGAPAAPGAGPEVLGVPEDLREAWAERVAIMEAAGGLPRAEAERVVWAGLPAAAAAR